MYSEILAPLPRERAALLPALQRLQADAGFLSLEALEAAAAHLRVPKSEVYGVVTHYPEFRLAPPGRRIVRVCTGVSCRVSGSPDLVSRLERDLEIRAGETRADGRATLEEMDCAFLCSMAPVVEVDHRCRGRVTAEQIRALLDESAPARAAPRPVAPAPPIEGRGPVTRWDALARAVSSRERLRLSVGAGSCGRAVGAHAIFERLRHEVARQGLGAEVIEGGCHGMCFAAPSVDLISEDGARLTFPRLATEALPALVAAVREGRQDGIPSIPWSPAEPFLARQHRLLTDRWGLVDPTSLADAVRHGSYRALARVLEEGSPGRVIAEVNGSGLQGRGGAYFPAAVKWDACRKAAGEPKYLVVNGEEGEPGIFKDRHLMEADPHRLLEGTLLAAYASGATRAILYIHGEADLSAERLAHAVAEAEAWGLLGDRILGADFSCQVELRRGAGGFILGEETALLESIEGRRAMPRTRPPFPVESGLWGKPTVINNVETLAAVPLIVERGGAWFSGLGQGHGTKLFGLSGHVARPGIVEVELGGTLREIIFEIGGGLRDGRPLQAALLGGPSGILVHPRDLDSPVVPRGRVNPGTGGLVVLDDSVPIKDVVRNLLAFNARESCGKCTPCREGTARMLEMLDGSAKARETKLRELAEVIQVASLCGLGQAAPLSVLSALDNFPEAFS